MVGTYADNTRPVVSFAASIGLDNGMRLTGPGPIGQSAGMVSDAEPRPSFEALLTRLEQVVAQLESSDLSLEAAIDAYQEGVRLAKEGHERLAEAERRVEEVSAGGRRAPFEPDSGEEA